MFAIKATLEDKQTRRADNKVRDCQAKCYLLNDSIVIRNKEPLPVSYMILCDSSFHYRHGFTTMT